MCPDRQIVSLYCDGELPSPWKEKMEAHLESCAECRGILAGYKKLQGYFQDFSQETVQEAEERVWKKLGNFVADGNEVTDGNKVGISDFPASTATSQIRRTGWQRERVWNRSVTLPLPAAAAAVIIIIGFLAFLAIGNASRPLPIQDSIAAAASIGFDEQGMLDIQDMNDVLQYLSSQDNIEFMVIRIPESWNFSRSGEPALINAADYLRRHSSR